jgi:amino-acid N-acetyltransferase
MNTGKIIRKFVVRSRKFEDSVRPAAGVGLTYNTMAVFGEESLIRDARLDDVPAIRELINSYAELDKMLFRPLADLYESLRDFKVFERDGQVVGCCALQVLWSDLAEIKSLAVRQDCQGQGIGTQLVQGIINEAWRLRLPRIFTLTLEKQFFEKQGFMKIARESLPYKVWSECIHCPKQDQCDEVAMMRELNQ